MSNYDFSDLPPVVQDRIRKDFNRIAGQDQNPNMISKTELQRFISDELTGRAHRRELTPRQTDEITEYFNNQFKDIDTNGNGMDIEEFTAMFGDKYMEQYEGSFWSSMLGFDMPRKTLNNIVGETKMDNVPVPTPTNENTNAQSIPKNEPDEPADSTELGTTSPAKIPAWDVPIEKATPTEQKTESL